MWLQERPNMFAEITQERTSQFGLCLNTSSTQADQRISTLFKAPDAAAKKLARAL